MAKKNQMKRIGICVVAPKQEQAELLAWAARADKGAPQRACTPKLHFATYRQLHATLTEKRMDLLEYVAKNEVPSIRQLAGQLARDYRNVYDDVQRLVQLGLIEIEAGALRVPYDEIDIRKRLREAA